MPDRKTDIDRDELSREQPSPLRGGKIMAVDLDLRSNGETEWQDERQQHDAQRRHVKTSSEETKDELDKTRPDNGGVAGDGDSARGGGTAPRPPKAG